MGICVIKWSISYRKNPTIHMIFFAGRIVSSFQQSTHPSVVSSPWKVLVLFKPLKFRICCWEGRCKHLPHFCKPLSYAVHAKWCIVQPQDIEKWASICVATNSEFQCSMCTGKWGRVRILHRRERAWFSTVNFTCISLDNWSDIQFCMSGSSYPILELFYIWVTSSFLFI